MMYLLMGIRVNLIKSIFLNFDYVFHVYFLSLLVLKPNREVS
jgi:hypothetical protein